MLDFKCTSYPLTFFHLSSSTEICATQKYADEKGTMGFGADCLSDVGSALSCSTPLGSTKLATSLKLRENNRYTLWGIAGLGASGMSKCSHLSNSKGNFIQLHPSVLNHYF